MVTIQRASSTYSDGAPVALVLPGAGYTVQGPLLYWPVLALVDAGWDVWSIDWHTEIDEAVRKNIQGFVESALAHAEATMPAPPELVIAKSLGTFALPHFAKQQVRAAWLTPILTDPTVAKALAGVSAGQHLAVGGTADPSWRPDLVGDTYAQLVTVETANHNLEVASKGWRESANVQLNIIDKVVTHLVDR